MTVAQFAQCDLAYAPPLRRRLGSPADCGQPAAQTIIGLLMCALMHLPSVRVLSLMTKRVNQRAVAAICVWPQSLQVYV